MSIPACVLSAVHVYLVHQKTSWFYGKPSEIVIIVVLSERNASLALKSYENRREKWKQGHMFHGN